MKYIIIGTLLFICCFSFKVNAQITSNFTSPATCGSNDGNITIKELANNTAYTIIYQKDGTNVNVTGTSNGDGILVIPNLSYGTYTNIVLTTTDGLATKTSVSGTYALINTCIAQQKTSFLAAAYQNFTGIQDDDPSNYTQIYAYLSQPLNKAQGIAYDSKKRFIWLRNGMFQITYGNTDKFTMYSFDSSNTKYVNRLDLLAHSYLNANASVNIITYILGKNWSKHSSDMAHIYLDAITSLLVTNVTDTLSKNDAALNKTYNVKSNLYGLALTAKFNDAFDSKFNIKAGWKLFWIVPSSSSVSGTLNPQNNNIPDIHSIENISKNFLILKNSPYVTFETTIQYNTGANQTNNSNIFLHYSYTSNYVKNDGSDFHNNYFQFQIGYALDLTKIFSSQSSSNVTGTQ